MCTFRICCDAPSWIRPSRGVLNLHPSYLPYNRGWHTPTWAILDGTPAGASLHYVDESLDTGDIVCQRHAVIDPADTAHTLYAKLKKLEVEVFKEGWQQITDGSAKQHSPDRWSRRPSTDGSRFLIRPCSDSSSTPSSEPRDLLRQLRALTTNRLDEAAYFETGTEGIECR